LTDTLTMEPYMTHQLGEVCCQRVVASVRWCSKEILRVSGVTMSRSRTLPIRGRGGCWNEIVTRVLGESFILTMGTASVIEVRAGRGRSSHLMVDRGNARLFEREARTTFRLRYVVACRTPADVCHLLLWIFSACVAMLQTFPNGSSKMSTDLRRTDFSGRTAAVHQS
jgi:hypothetical protein